MAREPQRKFLLLLGGIVLVLSLFFFPRVLLFAELAARELRYFWWLILMLGTAAWFAFSFGKKSD